MLVSARSVAALAVATLFGAASPQVFAQQTAYAIGNGGTTLLRFQTNNPGAVTAVGDFSGANTFLDGIAYRPATGQLYGYLSSSASFYLINPSTGQLTLDTTTPAAAPTNTFQLGLGFDPMTDRARIVTDSGQNISYDPGTHTSTAGAALAYGTGDANANTSPSIIDIAYTQNRAGAASTQAYGIDYGVDALVRIDGSTGALTTVGALGFNTDVYTGFDIFTSGANVDTGYAMLSGVNGASPGLYTVNLTTGASTLVGALGFTNQVYSLAVVPAPGAAVLAGVSMLGICRRRRAARA
jgi:hypothetical protein